MPGIAVDKTGRVEACFYHRRLDPKNFFFDRFCALSTDGGQTWADARQTRSSSPSIHATDTFINPFYMGDYDVWPATSLTLIKALWALSR